MVFVDNLLYTIYVPLAAFYFINSRRISVTRFSSYDEALVLLLVAGSEHVLMTGLDTCICISFQIQQVEFIITILQLKVHRVCIIFSCTETDNGSIQFRDSRNAILCSFAILGVDIQR